MSEEVSEVPNWLNELEAKREKRVKARLGHEAGAGAPCLLCADKCPGLDLHFWRKICKICKCTKENHDVHDDDIYGWAQFQLLGSRPNKIKRKIVLPGKRDEVELDWAPKGHNDTVEKFLKTLPPESLPVKGSQAAQDRKQLLQKQIPIHDIDPTLCHDLTESELKEMHNYIEHIKTNSVGVGHVVQLGMPHKGNLHQFDPINSSIVSTRCPQTLSYIETIGRGAPGLANALNEMHLDNNKMPKYNPEHIDIEENIQNERNFGIKNLNYETVNVPNSEHYDPICPNKSLGPKEQYGTTNSTNNTQYAPDFINKRGNLPHYAAGKLNIYNETQSPTTTNIKIKDKYNYNIGENQINENIKNSDYGVGGNAKNLKTIKDLALSTYDPTFPEQDTKNNNLNNMEKSGLKTFNPAHYSIKESNMVPDLINIGAIHDINYPINEIKTAQYVEPSLNNTEAMPPNNMAMNEFDKKHCHRCGESFKNDEFAISIERNNALYHSYCFTCIGCNQSLADMVYFYDKTSNDVYCGRDYAKIRGIPRCKACDELIFVKEYCLAENSTFHIKHFCCFECDCALAGQNYVVEDDQPLCIPCFTLLKAEKCNYCKKTIKADEQGVNINGVHFHNNDYCFACTTCRKPLLGAKLLLKNEKLYCSRECFTIDQCNTEL